jgi:3,4-dihydroxy 2-butanone 4-phosphate synthase/GTP cyclohydrolase II
MPHTPQPPFSPIDEVLDELRAGRMVVVTDDESRENEGDLILPAQFITPEAIMFMLKEATGYMFVSLPESDCDRLDLHGQSAVNTSARGTPLTVSVDGAPKHGFTTGVSAHERAKTIQMLIDPSTEPDDFVRPGHINPLRSRDGGVLVRVGHTEGIVDLCRLAGLNPGCVGIEIVHPEGRMMRVPDLAEFCEQHKLKMCSIKQIIEYRLSRSSIVERIDPAEGTSVRTPEGDFNLVAFRSIGDPMPHLALTVGDVGRLDEYGSAIEDSTPTLVRVHKRDLLGDIFDDLDSSGGSSTGQTLRASMRMIQKEGRGAIVYLRPHGVGDGLSQRLSRPFDHDTEDSVIEAISPEMVEYGTGSQILRALGLSNLRLITNSSVSYPQLEAFGLTISERVSPAL